MAAKFRPDVRDDYSPAEWNPPLGKHVGEPTRIPTLAPNEVRCACPKCGSAYVATFSGSKPAPAEPTEVAIIDARLYVDRERVPRPFARKADAALDGFACTAGDCGHEGLAQRS